MTDAELLIKIKVGLGISEQHTDDTIYIKMLAVKEYMANAGIALNQIETSLGIAALTIGVNDLWSLSSGEVKFSAAFSMLLTQLQVVSLS